MLRVRHLGKRVARQPVLVERVLVRLAQRRPQQARFLRLQPRHVLVGPGPDKALHDVEHMRPALVAAGGARHLPRPQIGFGRRRLEIGLRVVFAEQRHEVLQVARPMPCVMNQRPSLVWQMLGLWLGNSPA